LPALYYVVFFPLLFLRLENYKLNLFLFLFKKKKIIAFKNSLR
jgi:hypothetical protein